jgi:hypothetical protein
MKNKKIGRFFIVMSICLLLTGCSFLFPRVSSKPSETTIINAKVDFVIKAIEDKDKDALVGLFSEKALEECEDMDAGFDYLFKLFEGEILLDDVYVWYQTHQGPVGEQDEIDVYIIQAEFNSNNNIYYLYMIEYLVDTANDENRGVEVLYIVPINPNDEDCYSAMETEGIYGICIPEE